MGVVRGNDRVVQRRGSPWPPLQKLVDHEVGATELAVWINEVAPGEEVRRHTHDVEESIYVARGCMHATLGAESHALAAGDALFVPVGIVHGFTNTGPGPLSIVACLGGPNPRTFWHDVEDSTGYHLDQLGKSR